MSDAMVKQSRASIVNLHSTTYVPKYTHEILKGLMRPHRPNLRGTIRPSQYSVKLRGRDIKNWKQFVNFKEGQKNAPLSYLNSAGTFALFNLLSQLKINFSTLLHLKSEISFTDKTCIPTLGEVFTLTMNLDDVIIRNRKCILVISTVTRDSSGKVFRENTDFWFINRCDPKFMDKLNYPNRQSSDQFQGLSKRKSKLFQIKDQLESYPIKIKRNAGNEFAKVSGDYNIIHTTYWGARLCGQRRPFLQGFGLLNLCLHQLAQSSDVEFNKLALTFCNPALVWQELHLIRSGNSIEICDKKGKLIAFGNL